MAVHVSYMPFIVADGTIMAHILFIKGKRLMSEWAAAWPEAYFLMTESGGIDNESWLKVVDIILDVAPPGMKIMLDSHKTRDSDWRAEYELKEAKIDVTASEPNTSHKTQPLDGLPFKTFKRKYDQINFEKRTEKGLPMTVLELIMSCKEALEAVTPEIIRQSFKATGTHPFNPDIFPDKVFAAAEVAGKSLAAARLKAGLPALPDVGVFDSEAVFGPLAPPAWVKLQYEKKTRVKTVAAHLTGEAHIARLAMLEKEADAEDAAKTAAKAAAKAARDSAKEEAEKAKEERRVAKAAKDALKSAAAAASGKKRKTGPHGAAASAGGEAADGAAACVPPPPKKARNVPVAGAAVAAAAEPAPVANYSKSGRAIISSKKNM